MQAQTVDRMTWHAASATVDMLPGGVLRVRMRGPLTRAALESFAAGLGQVGADARALLIDYSGAVVVATCAELDAMVAAAPRNALVRQLPGALVGTPDMAEALRAHAIRLLKAGYRRRAFTSLDAGHLWAIRRCRS